MPKNAIKGLFSWEDCDLNLAWEKIRSYECFGNHGFLSLYSGYVTDFSLLLKRMVSKGQTCACHIEMPLAFLLYTGCLWNSHLATGFPPHVFQLPSCASHTFIFEAYQHCLLYFKCWYGWMTISRKMRATFSSFYTIDLTCHWLSDRPVWLPPQFFNVLSWSRQENDTWGIVLYD